MRIAGISSRKFGDDNYEEELKNNDLYNDKELFDDADLNWYDYGFRNYDPQIGRFPQLDPLTDRYPELTPYQYASDEPIANVDMDGLEAIGSTVASSVGDAVVKSSSFMPNIVVQGLSKAAVVQKTFNAINIGINAFKLGTNVADKTIVNTLVNTLDASKMQTDSYLASIFSKMANWVDRVSHGSGSYQDYGIVFTGNNNGTMEFKDRAGTVVDAIDLGPLFFGGLKIAGLDPKVFEELLSSPGGLKYVANFLEAGNTTREAGEIIKELVETSKEKFPGIDPMFKKKGNVIYHRDAGYKTRNIDGKGGGVLTNNKATDTFPREKLEPFYSLPLNNP